MTQLAVNENDDDRDIALSRVFDAPRELVYEVWTQPEHLAQWYGPDGFSITTYEMNFSVGGMWRFMMHGPDGTDYPNVIIFRKIVPNERLEFWHADDADKPAIEFNVVVTFEQADGGTKVTLRNRFATVEEKQRVIDEFGAIEGGKQTLGRLCDYLVNLQGGAK